MNLRTSRAGEGIEYQADLFAHLTLGCVVGRLRVLDGPTDGGPAPIMGVSTHQQATTGREHSDARRFPRHFHAHQSSVV